MAEPEDQDKRAPSPLEDDFDDDLIGFAHPRALEPSRPPEPEQEPGIGPEATPEPALEPAAPFIDEPEPLLAPAAVVPADRLEADRASVEPSSEPDRALDPDFGRPGATRTFDRAPSRPSEPGVTAEGDGRLAMAIYICLIGAAPSAGLTLVLALILAWMARFMIQGWTRSHLLYQLRTSLIGTIGGVVGVLTLPLGLGVFVLSLTLIWVVVRGAAGLYRLVRRQPIRDPQTWSLP